MVGLANVDNVRDADKQISTATQTELDKKAPKLNPVFTGNVEGIDKSMVGLGNVDNVREADKEISTATQTELDKKAPKLNPAFTGIVSIASNVMFEAEPQEFHSKVTARLPTPCSPCSTTNKTA